MNLRFLGVAEIERDGMPVHLQRRHSLALLAYLVLTGRPHSREALATFLSGDLPDSAARKLLRNALADLAERGLGAYLVTGRQSVAFNTDLPCSVDVRLVDEFSAIGGQPSAVDLQWAADRCDWELLAGFSLRDAPEFELWLLSEREHRSQQMTALAHRQLASYLWGNQLDAGIALARRLLALEPWHEATHRTLMQLLARSGQPAAALAQYERCREALDIELGVEPQPETTALFDRLRAGSVVPRTNLPDSTSGTSSLFGRDEELDMLTRNLVDPGCRLQTIVGIGGIGKTRLALAAAERLAEPASFFDEHPFADGIFIVNPSDIVDPDGADAPNGSPPRQIVTAIGFALGLAFYGRIDRAEQVAAYLRSKRTLLVIDNFEPLLDDAPIVQFLLKRAPGVTILITSRAPLGLEEEWTLWLDGLRLPDDDDDIERAPASQLFLNDARRTRPSIDPTQYAAVAQICRLTGGLPLALKIVAAWSGLMTLAEIEAELVNAGPLLREPADGDNRQPSIQAVMSASVDGLVPADRLALVRLAVFQASFDRPAAEAVGVAFAGLLRLCQRSFVERIGGERYTLHPLVRRLIVERLASDKDEESAARTNHATYFASFVAARTHALRQRPEVRTEIVTDHHNLQAAWDWAVVQRDINLLDQLLDGLASWNELAGLHREWSDSLNVATQRLRGQNDDRRFRETFVRLLVSQAEALLWLGDIDRALSLIDEARMSAQLLDDLRLEALISLCEGRLFRFRNDPLKISESLQQARVLARVTHQRRIEANSLLQICFAAVDGERYAEADGLLERAEQAFRDVDDRLSLGRTTHHHGRLNIIRGDYTAAQMNLEQCLHLARTFGDRFLESSSQVYLGVVSDIGSGSHHAADAYFGRALAIQRQTGDPYLEGIIHRSQGHNAMHAGDFRRAEQHFEHALERARDVNNNRALNDSVLCLARLAYETGEWDLAENRALQAMRLSTDQGRQHAGASALLVLGLARERLGHLSDAAAAFTQTFATANALQLPYLRADAATGLASVSLTAGDNSLALRYIEDVLASMRERSLAGCDEPGWSILTSLRVLSSAHDARGDDVLKLGASLLERRMAALPSSLRSRYIRAFPDRMAVVRLWLARGGADSQAISLDRSLQFASGDERFALDRLPIDHPREHSTPPDVQQAPDSQRRSPTHIRRRLRTQRPGNPPTS